MIADEKRIAARCRRAIFDNSFFHGATKQSASSQRPSNSATTREESALAEVSKVDHHVRKRFQCVMQLANAFEAQKQTFELIFPGEHALNGPEAFFKKNRIKERN